MPVIKKKPQTIYDNQNIQPLVPQSNAYRKFDVTPS